MNFLKLDDTIKLYFNCFETGLIVFLKYSIFFSSILLGYACIALILYGSYLTEFATLSNSFIQVLLFSVGYINPQALLMYNSGETIFFILTFYLFVINFMYSVFIALYAESYRRTTTKYGLPDDMYVVKWRMKDYIVWLCYCYSEKKNTDDKEGM